MAHLRKGQWFWFDFAYKLSNNSPIVLFFYFIFKVLAFNYASSDSTLFLRRISSSSFSRLARLIYYSILAILAFC
jgi:hypothetical protein